MPSPIENQTPLHASWLHGRDTTGIMIPAQRHVIFVYYLYIKRSVHIMPLNPLIFHGLRHASAVPDGLQALLPHRIIPSRIYRRNRLKDCSRSHSRYSARPALRCLVIRLIPCMCLIPGVAPAREAEQIQPAPPTSPGQSYRIPSGNDFRGLISSAQFVPHRCNRHNC